MELASVTDQKQIKVNQEAVVKVEPVANRPDKVEIAAEPIVRETEEMLGLIMAQQDELQRRQITEAEKTEREAQPVITELQPRVEKLPVESRSPQPKLAVKVEGSTSQDVLPEVSSPTLAKAPGALLEEKLVEPTMASGKDEEYKSAILVTEAIVEHQIVSEDSAPSEITVATFEIADNSSTDELPDFFYTSGTEILPIEEGAMPQPADLIETDVLQDDEVVFDNEVIATFEQMVGLINLEDEEENLVVSEAYEAFMQDKIVFLNQEITEPIEEIETDTFAEFIITKPQPEKKPDIAVIIADASDKTLEYTLVQLSFYLAEATQDSENTDIEVALKEVVKSLPRSNTSYLGGPGGTRTLDTLLKRQVL